MINKLTLSIYFIFLILVCLYAYKRPQYNWDMLPYMAIVLQHDMHDPKAIHDSVYALASRMVPSPEFHDLTDGGLAYRRKMTGNAWEFQSQLPYYVVKPLYTRLVYYFYRAGFSLAKATVLPSVISYFLIGGFLFLWIKKYLAIPFSAVVSGLFMVSSPMLEIARLSTPDALSALLLSASLYFLIEGKGLARFYLLLILSLFARLDNIVFVILILAGAGLVSKSFPEFTKSRFMMMVAGVILCFFSITYLAIPYGWNWWYYPSFLKSMNLSYEASAQFELRAYVALAISHILTGLFYTHLILFLISGLMIFIGEPDHSIPRPTQDQLLVWIFIVFVVVRFMLHPVVADRFYIHIYLCTLILLIRKIRIAPGTP